MGADGSIHVFTIKDLGAWEQLTTRFGVEAYLNTDFLRQGLHVAWEYRADGLETFRENVHRIHAALIWLHPDQHPEWQDVNFKAWIESRPLPQWLWDDDWWEMGDVDPTGTVGEFLTLWNAAIEDYHGEYEVWT